VDDRQLIRATLRRLSHRLRLVRAATAGSRFATAGLVAALVPLLLKGSLPAAWPWVAGVLVIGLAAVGAVFGAVLRVRPTHVARLADRRLRLKERLGASVEHLSLDTLPDMVRAQLAETAARLRDLRLRDAFPLRLGTEARVAGPVVALALALALLPPLPLRFPERDETADAPAADLAEAPSERRVEPKVATPVVPKDLRPKAERQDAVRGPLAPHAEPGDQAAVFRDTKMSERLPDFGSFVKQGDERLKLLARPEALPDLQRDFTQSPYQVMIRRMQEQLRAGSLQGLSWEQIEQLMSALGQMEQRMGGGSDIADELAREMEGQSGRAPDKMLSALSRAMNRLRDRDEASRGRGKGLRDAPSRQAVGDGKGNGEAGREDGAPGGSAPGTEPSLQTRGDATPRIEGEKQDAGLSGDPRAGPTESYDTNLYGPGAKTASRLPYLDVLGRYRRMMEEALTKEPIPFSYREQVKEYFKALEAR